ncbi:MULTISPECIES: ribosomal maturation YjgA family protein [Flavobacteriaceae]|uniref:DUF2809 domain-containing protein n=2 Tax=Flavobacteriaceae TaxID=49546 RepID=A0A4Y8AUU6_9FLAO|nr:DUF2809 domain-containing protein [Gramella jeungdoensis]GGK41282.1 hypothetical protein GCM10007963_06640 [Lutibacter litoralis]
MFKFNNRSFLAFAILFTIEILIAVNLKKGFIRFTFGDFLVVIMLYYFLKSFLKIKTLHLALTVLFFSYFIESIQPINILEILNLQKNTTLRVIFGTTFSIEDLIAYTLGICTVLIIEKYLNS